MALDYEKLKKAAQELQARMNRGGGPSMKFWRPESGKNLIRVLPPWTDEGVFAGQFHREVHQHWRVAGEDAGPVLCPKKTPEASDNKECPICDFAEQLKARKNDLEAQKLYKDIRAKVAYLMSIVDLNDAVYTAKNVAEWKKERPDQDCPFEVGDAKIQCYAATSSIADRIMDIVLANEMDITSLDAGFNIVITKIPNRDPLKTRYTVTPELKPTKAPVDKGVELPDLSKIGKVQSVEDMLKLLSEGAGASYTAALPAETGGDDTSWAGSDDDDLAAEMRSQLGE